MINILNSSIGKKLIMSITGLFLILFLLVHLFLNLLTLLGPDVFNSAAHFMGTNPIMKVMEIALAGGFLFHMIYATYLTFTNQLARPVKYAVSSKTKATSWASKNMFITGFVVLIFLVIHLMNYYYKIKFTDLIETGKMSEYDLVVGLFQPNNWYYVIIYVLWFILLGLHLNHSFQSAFQTLGLNNKNWISRLRLVGILYALLISVGFSIIPIYFFIKALI